MCTPCFLYKIANISKVGYYTANLKFCENFDFTLKYNSFEFMKEKQRGYPYVFFRFRLKYYKWTSSTLHGIRYTYIIVIFNSIATSLEGCYPTSRITWRGGLAWLLSERGLNHRIWPSHCAVCTINQPQIRNSQIIHIRTLNLNIIITKLEHSH